MHGEALSVITEHQITLYRGRGENLEAIAVAFAGSPRNSSDPGKILLLNDPFSRQTFFYEFRVSDILYAEELPHLSRANGSTVNMVRLWVKKGSTALKVEPFHVQDTAQSLQEFL